MILTKTKKLRQLPLMLNEVVVLGSFLKMGSMKRYCAQCTTNKITVQY